MPRLQRMREARGADRWGWSEVSSRVRARRAYRAYRRRQAAELLEVMPDEAVRPLYRRARRWAVERDRHDAKDPMRTLLAYCESLLPLPPFDVWLRDASGRSEAHLDELDRSRPSLENDAPLALEVRSFTAGDREWRATLNLYRKAGAWRGFVGFRSAGRGGSFRTAEIFREPGPRDVVARFRNLDDASLRAFLRSVRP